MADKTTLAKVLGKKRFSVLEDAFHKHISLGLETRDETGKIIPALCSEGGLPEFCRIIRGSKEGNKKCQVEYCRALEIASELKDVHFTICHAGILLGCLPVMKKGKVLAGVYLGRCLWEPATEVLKKDLVKRLGKICPDSRKLVEAFMKLEIIDSPALYDAARSLFYLIDQTLNSEDRSPCNSSVLASANGGLQWHYPLESERELIAKVRMCDKTGADEMLSHMLDEVVHHANGNKVVLKARLLEQLSLLSRAAISGGAEIETVLHKNVEYINQAIHLNSEQALCVLMRKAMNQFMTLVCTSQDARKVTQIRPAIEYMEANYTRPLSLADVAKVSHMSISRLVHLFKEQMGTTIIGYLTNIRIERAKEMLLTTDRSCTEICFAVGYNNQSYFTRVFKNLAGMTPTQFRVNNQR